MTAWKTLPLAFGLALATAPFVTSAKADEWNKETTMTFDNPVEIQGRVLLPVEIFNDKDRLVTIVTGIPDYRVKTPSTTVVTFSEGRKDSPESIHEWFYPGDNSGLEFLPPAK